MMPRLRRITLILLFTGLSASIKMKMGHSRRSDGWLTRDILETGRKIRKAVSVSNTTEPVISMKVDGKKISELVREPIGCMRARTSSK